jgi:small nuclear ribonucleoprotein (snRNP)-like protein
LPPAEFGHKIFSFSSQPYRPPSNPAQDAILQVCIIPSPTHIDRSNFMSPIFIDKANSNSFFKTLVDHQVTVELKNDISIRGTLKSVDQYLNIKLENIEVLEVMKYPHLVRPHCFATFHL